MRGWSRGPCHRVQGLARRGEGGGQAGVCGVVAGAPDRAGQDPRGDQAAVPAHKQLRRRAEHAVDGEDPGVVVAPGQGLQHPARVDGFGRFDEQVAGERDRLAPGNPLPPHGVAIQIERHAAIVVDDGQGE